MMRWIAMPLFLVVLMFSHSQANASDFRVGLGVNFGDGYAYYPSDTYYTTYYPYTYDTYGYYVPTYTYTTTSPWYSTWYGDGYRSDYGYWRGSYWDGGRRGSWDGRGTFSGRSGGFVGRSHRR